MQTNVVSGDLDCNEVTARFIAGCCVPSKRSAFLVAVEENG